MTDDKSAKDSARDPEREALGPVSGGIRAAARKAAKKIAKKAGQKKTTKKTASAARPAKKAAKTATKREKPASGRTAAPASRTSSARTSTAKSAAAGASVQARAQTRAQADAQAVPNTGGAGAAAAASSGGIASVATPPENGSTFGAPRPPAPMHPGASLDTMHEHAGGFGSMLALWGPLIIVGFLVLVFRGGDEREEAVAARSDAASPATAGMPDDPARGPWAEMAGGTRPAERAPGSPGTGRGAADAFDGGFTMRTSMASPPAYTGRDPGGRMPASARARFYPSPPGPYRDPRYRGLPTGESWSNSSPDWLWSADAPGVPRYEDGGDRSVQWVRCEPPYYWCPAPSKPVW